MTLLTIYTPTYKRPKALAYCIQSVGRQTDQDTQHLIIPDDKGIGIAGVYRDVRLHGHKVEGDYCLFLSDDDYLYDNNVVADFRQFVNEHDKPEVVMAKGIREGKTYPAPFCWQAPPMVGFVTLFNVITRRDVWIANATAWGECYEGDYFFMRHLWDAGYLFTWWDRTICATQRVSRGKPE